MNPSGDEKTNWPVAFVVVCLALILTTFVLAIVGLAARQW